ncbi:Flavinator of succinate dehydrogenase [Gracilaria domingensis]|nr:Flavinator of succinate dehydrogenase [Gracilaria domingensis]
MVRGLANGAKEWKAEHLRAPQGGAQIPDNVSVRQKQIIYRSKQRGWLELDILFGNWAAKHVPLMNEDGQLSMTEDLLNADTPDVLKWVLGQQEPPVRFQNEVMDSLREYAMGDGHVNER